MVHRLVIERGRVTYRDYRRGTNVAFGVTSLEGSTDEGTGDVIFKGEGRLQKQPWRLLLRAGSFGKLRVTAKPYPVDLTLIIADTRGRIQGTLKKPLQLQGVDLKASLQGPVLSSFNPFLPAPAPHLPAYKIEARVTRAGDIWRMQDLRATVGESRRAGEAAR